MMRAFSCDAASNIGAALTLSDAARNRPLTVDADVQFLAGGANLLDLNSSDSARPDHSPLSDNGVHWKACAYCGLLAHMPVLPSLTSEFAPTDWTVQITATPHFPAHRIVFPLHCRTAARFDLIYAGRPARSRDRRGCLMSPPKSDDQICQKRSCARSQFSLLLRMYTIPMRLHALPSLYAEAAQSFETRVVDVGSSTTKPGSWYATVLPWRRQIAMLVNEPTLLPVLLPLAPATSLVTRLPEALAEILAAHRVSHSFIESEVSQMRVVKYAGTQNRSVVGIMTQFAYLAEGCRADEKMTELIELSLKLAHTPCGPLYKGPVSPDTALKELTSDE